MEFSREGNNIIRCVISEEEIEELGYTIDDIISNGRRTQQFMNQIFDLAEQEFDTKFELGIKSVRADILPDHTISLTFSEQPGPEGVMDHIKDIVNGLLGSVSKQKWEELKGMSEKTETPSLEKIAGEKSPKIVVLFAFEELDTLMRYAKQVTVEQLPFNQLYKFDGVYFLMMDMTNTSEMDAKKLSALTDEYAADIFVGSEKRAFIYEHGKEILKERAIEQLREI